MERAKRGKSSCHGFERCGIDGKPHAPKSCDSARHGAPSAPGDIGQRDGRCIVVSKRRERFRRPELQRRHIASEVALLLLTHQERGALLREQQALRPHLVLRRSKYRQLCSGCELLGQAEAGRVDKRLATRYQEQVLGVGCGELSLDARQKQQPSDER